MVGIIDWTKDDIKNLDKRTRKIMTMTGSLHIRSDVDRLYVNRKDRSRGILSIEDVLCSRMIGLCEHIEKVRNTNIFLNKVYTHERDCIVRLSTEFKREFMGIAQDTYDACSESTQFSDKIKSCLNTYPLHKWQSKVTRGYLHSKAKENKDVNMNESYGWLKSENFSSQIEDYLFSLQEQEVNT